MGLFKKIKKAIKHPVSTVKKVAATAIKNPARASFAVASLGTTEVARKAPGIGSTFSKGFDKGFAPIYQLGADYVTAGKFSAAQSLAQATLVKGDKMGFNLSGFLGAAGSALGGVQGGNAGVIRAAGSIASIASAAIAPKAVPAMAMKPIVQGGMTALGLAGPVAAGAVSVGKRFFQKFPNLATALAKFRNAGMKQVTRQRLYSMLKRFGPELLISGGILTAAAVNELMLAGPGTRRMNSANVKALRRSVRRIESFHKLCRTVDVLRSKGGRKGRKCSTGGTFVRQG